MKPFHFFFRFTRGQRKGIIALFLFMVLLQAGYLVFSSIDTRTSQEQSEEEKEWLALQHEIDALKAKKAIKKNVIYPFNPNFISDYKGYTLGMSVAQIDRLHKFRATGKFINSAADFKAVTKVPDSLLAKLSPYFKFPDWVIAKQKRLNEKSARPAYSNDSYSYKGKPDFKKEEKKIVVQDINTALEEDLDKVYGIGPAFAKKILRRRAQLGAFVSMDQMEEFEDFSAEAVQGLKKGFKIMAPPDVAKININSASLNQLTYFPYFNRSIAKAVITKRSMKGKITKVEELIEINDFPVEKVKIIALYLEF
jgi:DNA uptake protein ComE-like DNA-binding protein